MKHIIFFCFLLMLATLTGKAQEKKVINSIDELPKHVYTLPNTQVNELLNNDDQLHQLADEIKSDLLSDLGEYDIQDHATLRQYYGMLQLFALLDKDYDQCLMYIEQGRQNADKESERLLFGLVTEQLVTILEEETEAGIEDVQTPIKERLIKEMEGMDFGLIQSEIEQRKGSTEIYSENLFQGIVQSQIQPVVDNNEGTVPLDIAASIVNLWYLRNYYLPLKDDLAEVYGYMLDTYGVKEEKQDIWSSRSLILPADEKLSPVVVGIWDTGVDVEIFPEKNRWENKNEVINNEDDDGNGFIDDYYGIAYDMKGEKSSSILLPEMKDEPDREQMEKGIKGLMDLQANINSEEANDLKIKLSHMFPEDVEPFIQQISMYGDYAHGTHVAGIVADGNPVVKILTARLSFDYRTMPFVPDETSAENWADMFTQVVNYFKANNVKVVNMSWTVGLETEFLSPMRLNGYGDGEEERMTQAKKLFDIEQAAFEKAVESAPDILFVCAAGNNNNDVDFAMEFPASLNLSNIITVGAVDIEGNKTGFTTEGASVDV